MQSPPSSAQRYATLLAKKCFLSPNDGEIEALLGLNLDINWASKLENGGTLAEMAFTGINDQKIFKKWWSSIQTLDPSFTPWNTSLSGVDFKEGGSFIAHAIINCRWDTAEEWLKDYPATPDNWKQLAQSFLIKKQALDKVWPNFEPYLQKIGVPLFFINDLQSFRNEYLWLSSKTATEFESLAPKELTPKQALLWWGEIVKGLSKSSSSSAGVSWRLSKLIDAKSGWSKWTTEDWEEVWSTQSPGLMSFYLPYANLRSQLSPSQHIQEWISAYTWRACDKNLSTLWNEVNELVQVVDSGSYNLSTSSSPALHHLKAWANICNERLETSSQQDSKNRWNYGLWNIIIDTSILKATAFSENGIKKWSSVELPKRFEDLYPLLFQDPSGQKLSRSYAHSLTSPNRIAIILSHLLRAKESDIPAMQEFTDSITLPISLQDSNLLSKDDDAALASVLAPWCARSVVRSSDPLVQAEWAHLFWRSIFLIEPANQHYWLKKAAALKELQVPLRFWNDDFFAVFNQAIVRRKKTTEIVSLLSKMSILNETAQVVKLSAKTDRKPSKM